MFTITPVEISPALLHVGLSPHISINTHIGIGYLGPQESNVASTPLSELTLPGKQLPNQPYLLALLNWKARLSAFSGREKEMAILSEWFSSEPAISMKFICGSGGVGKTRLAAEFAQYLRKNGCAAGFVKVNNPQKFHLNKNGTLIIVDYPEDFPNEIPSLLQGLVNYGSDRYRLRILFLTRQPQSAWLHTIEENHAIGLLERNPLEPELLSGSNSHKIYISALGEASTILDKPPPEGVSEKVFTEWLNQYPDHNRPLFILAAALHSALTPEDNFLRYSSSHVVQTLAEREKALLRNRAESNGFAEPNALVKLAVLATLRDGLSFLDILDLKKKELISCRVNRMRLRGNWKGPVSWSKTSWLLKNQIFQRLLSSPIL